MDFTADSFAQNDGSDGAQTAGTGLVYLSQLADFAPGGLKDVYASPTTPEQEVTIDGDHEWATGKGAAPFAWDQTTEETKLMAAMNGEGRGANNKTELVLFFPGKSRKIEALLKKRPPLIGHVGDVNCGNGKYVQVGTKCNPAFISNYEFNQGNAKAGESKGYTITLEAYSEAIINYDGPITVAPAS